MGKVRPRLAKVNGRRGRRGQLPTGPVCDLQETRGERGIGQSGSERGRHRGQRATGNHNVAIHNRVVHHRHDLANRFG